VSAPAKPYADRLDGYIEVKERIRLFLEQYPEGRLMTAEVRWPQEGDDTPRIAVKALAYRSPEDIHPGVGWSWMVLPGSTPYTRGSELENTETSAWGRAIGSLGIGIANGIASAQEVRAKSGNTPAPERPEERLVSKGRIVRSGTVRKGSGERTDLLPHLDPGGHLVGFRLEMADGKAIPQVFATGPLGTALAAHLDVLLGAEVQVGGEAFEVTAPGRKPYARMMLDAIEGPFGILPDPTVPAGPMEAESEPLFSPEAQRALDEQLAAL
jgi:hypothetical protein